MDGAGVKMKKAAIAGRKLCNPKKKPVSQSMKAGLQFPIGRIGRYLKKGQYTQHVGTDAPVYLTTVLGYLAVGPRVQGAQEGHHQVPQEVASTDLI